MGQEALTKNSLTRLMRTGWLGKELPLVPSSTRITKQIAGQFSLLRHIFSSRVATIEAEIAPNQWNGTTNRTQTIEESLDESLLGVLIPLEGSSRASQSATNVTDEILKEALCRDLEAFDEVFEVDDLDHRPEYCPPIKNSMCAVLYDRWSILLHIQCTMRKVCSSSKHLKGKYDLVDSLVVLNREKNDFQVMQNSSENSERYSTQ